MDIYIKSTIAGTDYGVFTDLSDRECSIQESFSTGKNTIWLGVDEGTTFRIHLNQDGVAALLPILQYFVEHGELPFNGDE